MIIVSNLKRQSLCSSSEPALIVQKSIIIEGVVASPLHFAWVLVCTLTKCFVFMVDQYSGALCALCAHYVLKSSGLHQMLIEHAAGLEGEGNNYLIHFFSKTILNSKYLNVNPPPQMQSYALYKYYQLANLTMGQWESFPEPLILAELKVQCTRSNVRDNVSWG